MTSCVDWLGRQLTCGDTPGILFGVWVAIPGERSGFKRLEKLPAEGVRCLGGPPVNGTVLTSRDAPWTRASCAALILDRGADAHERSSLAIMLTVSAFAFPGFLP